jgi:uncharacterized Fe-S cluster protein YjdI
MGKHVYKNDRIAVTWDSDVCIHAAECVKCSPKVFDTSKKPWVNVDGETNDEIIATIKKCPSGALQYETSAANSEADEDLTSMIAVGEDGPLRVSGKVHLTDAEGNTIETRERFSLCRCGASENKPFCDGSHKKIEFKG